MSQRCMFVIAGLVVLPVVGAADASAQSAPSVPSPVAPITPADGWTPGEAGPVPATPATAPAGDATSSPGSTPAPTPGETLPTTPAPTPYAGPTPYPGAPPPTPYAAPGAPPVAPRAGFDLGGQSVAPLPPPPPPVNPGKIRREPWRGRYWLSFRMVVNGPLGGDRPARPGVLGIGGGADFGWRVNNLLGLGMGLSGHYHGRTRKREVGTQDFRTTNDGMLYWDALFARVFLPLKRRFQPYVEVGGGLARLKLQTPDAASGGTTRQGHYGGQLRAGLGLEGWISTNVTLGVSGIYRFNAFRDLPGRSGWTVGHGMQGAIELGFHW